MKTNDENLTVQQSLDIITGMIHQAKGNARARSFYFLLWGWVIVIANLGMYVLIQLHFSMPFIVWVITIPAVILSIYRGLRDRQRNLAKTHLDSITGWLWIGFGVCAFTIVFFGYKINYQINPLILIMSSIPTLVSGVMIRFKPLMVGAILFWVFGILSFIVPMEFQNLVGAVAIICGYLIPGYMLKSKKS